jgi:multiple sugar transport system ATP-binding protein
MDTAVTPPAQFTLGIRPEDIQPASDGEFSGKITLVEPLGLETIVHIQAGEQTLLSLVAGITSLRLGDEVHFNIVRDRLHYFDQDGNRVN